MSAIIPEFSLSLWKHTEVLSAPSGNMLDVMPLTKSLSHRAYVAAVPPHVPERGSKTLGALESLQIINAVTKVNKQPATISLPLCSSPSPFLPHDTQQEGKASLRSTLRQVTDMSHHLKPCGTIIPLSLWRERRVGEGDAEVRTELEWVSESRSGGRAVG